MIGQLPQPRAEYATIGIENVGTYLIGGKLSSMRGTTDFLAEGTTEWAAGPAMPVNMDHPCAVKISDQSFLIIDYTNIREYQVDTTNPTSNSGWQTATKWPQLQRSREEQSGCSKIGNYIVVGGGWSVRSSEVLNLSTKSIVYAGDMNSPRAWFRMATIRSNGREMLLAFGGHSGSSRLNSVEQFVTIDNTWTMASTTLKEAKSSFGAVVLPKEMICPTT